MKYLLLDTSGHQGFVAWAEAGQVISTRFTTGYNSHLEEIPIFAEQLLAKHGPPEVVAVIAGPGSYTGLRVGLSLAKGICFGSGAQLLLPDTLAVMCEAFLLELGTPISKEARLIPMMDARRMEVFHAVYHHDGAVEVEPIPLIVTEQWVRGLHHASILLGDGASKVKQFNHESTLSIYETIVPTPQALLNLSLRAANNNQFVPLAQAVPRYTKAFYTTAQLLPEPDASDVRHGSE